MGIQFTDADLENKGELSDDELDMVAGGASVDCFCLFGGGGTGDSNDNTCACVVAGFGFPKNSIIDRCVCAVTGFGKDT